MKAECPVNSSWTVPSIRGLKATERDGRWLCLNPEVPSWLCTTRPGALLLQMADGQRSIQEYHDLLAVNGVEVPLDSLVDFFQSAVARLFEEPRNGDTALDSWESRKLSGLYLHVTDRCNLQCTYCYRESSPRLSVLHDSAKVCAMLEFIQPFSVPKLEITFSGGEPLMHPGFREVIETSSRLGYTNRLLTNGTLIGDDMADFIAAHFRGVKISLDGPNEEIHSRTRGKGNFARVLRGVERLAVRGVNVAVQVTLTKSSLPHVAEIRAALPDLPNVKVRNTPLLPMGRGTGMDGEYIDNDDFYDFTRSRGGGLRFVRGQRNRGCHAGAGSLSIADTGDVYPCHLFHADPYLLGNIFHDSFEDIFFGEKAKAFARSMDVEENNAVAGSASFASCAEEAATRTLSTPPATITAWTPSVPIRRGSSTTRSSPHRSRGPEVRDRDAQPVGRLSLRTRRRPAPSPGRS